MNFFIKKISILVLFICFGSQLVAQDSSKIFVLSKKVGDTISMTEKIQYGLFPFYKRDRYKFAVFYQTDSGNYFLKAWLIDSINIRPFSAKEIAQMKQIIGEDPVQTNQMSADTGKVYRIIMIDETQFIGKVIARKPDVVVIRTSSIPSIDIPLNKIKKMELVDKENMKDGTYWFPNPHSTRYLFGPSGFSLKPGEGYYQNTYVVINSFQVGITKNISMGGGFEIITLVSGSPIFFITPKATFKAAEKLHLGGGILLASIPAGRNGRSFMGIGYGMGTYGTMDHNITAAAGWGFVDGELAETPMATISGMTRVSKRVALVSENWIVPVDGSYAVYSYGVRFFGEKMAVDIAFINNSDLAQVLIIGIPYIDLVVKF